MENDERLKMQEKFKKQDEDYAKQYRNGKSKTIEKVVQTLQGEKYKTIRRTTYPNGVVKDRLVKVEKNLGGGKRKRIF